jgi:Putative auto-transporter adhesin, head GIN domain
MKKIVISSLCFLFTTVLFAQKQINDANAEVRNVKNFHAIRVATGIDLILTQGSTEAVAVSAPNIEDRNRIITVVENGVLKIHYDYNFWRLLKERGNKRLKAYVSIINIDNLDIASGAVVNVDGSLKADHLGLDASSGGVFKGAVQVTSIVVDQSSGAIITISGSASSLKVDGSSGSVFHGYDLVVDNCNADMSSGSGASITINKELTAEASSGGHVSYKGNAVIRNIRTSSGGSINRKS